MQFIHFPFTAAQAAKFRAPGTEVVVGFGHGAYGRSLPITELPEPPEGTRIARVDVVIRVQDIDS